MTHRGQLRPHEGRRPTPTWLLASTGSNCANISVGEGQSVLDCNRYAAVDCCSEAVCGVFPGVIAPGTAHHRPRECEYPNPLWICGLDRYITPPLIFTGKERFDVSRKTNIDMSVISVTFPRCQSAWPAEGKNAETENALCRQHRNRGT